MKRTVFSIVFVALFATASIASAQSSMDAVLRAIDTVPTRQQLDANFDDAPTQLMAAASDAKRTIHERHRALSLLSFYPDQATRDFLQRLGEDRDQPAEIRKLGVYTLGRTFGPDAADTALVATMRRFVADEEPLVREWAVRSLRWVAAPGAEQLLREVLASEATDLHATARRALAKRAKGPAQVK